MRTQILVGILASSVASLWSCSDSRTSRLNIIGGEDRSNPGFFAGVVHAGENRPYCGASFIDDRVLLTAAHCIAYLNDRVEVIPLVSNLNENDLPRYSVKSAIIHPEWNEETVANDIALIFLEQKAQGISKVSLDDAASITNSVEVIGWGDMSTHGTMQPEMLQGVTLHPISADVCRTKAGYDNVTASQFCAIGPDQSGQDSCYGDSGGPAYSKDETGNFLIQGIISWGKACAQSGNPGVLTRVSTYADWITETIKIESSGDPAFSTAAGCYDRLIDTYAVENGKNSITFTNYVRPNPWSISQVANEPDQSLILKSCSSNHLALKKAIDPGTGESNYFFFDQDTKQRIEASTTPSMTYFCNDQASYIIQTYGDIIDGDFWLNGEFKVARSVSKPIHQIDQIASCLVLGKKLEVYKGNAGELLVSINQNNFWSIEDYIPIRNIEISLSKEGDNKANLTISNFSDTDLYTWNLSCRERFEIIDEQGVNFPATENKSNHFWSHSFRHSIDPWSSIKKGENLVMKVMFDTAADWQCTVNSVDASNEK